MCGHRARMTETDVNFVKLDHTRKNARSAVLCNELGPDVGYGLQFDGHLRVIASIETLAVIEQILEHHRRSTGREAPKKCAR